jgi:hypothetical protein
MSPPETPLTSLPTQPICIGLTCWLWQRKDRVIVRLARQLDVTLELKERVRGLHRDIEARVSGRNVDRFIGEFVRHC